MALWVVLPSHAHKRGIEAQFSLVDKGAWVGSFCSDAGLGLKRKFTPPVCLFLGLLRRG